jgi:hypothetical protein
MARLPAYALELNPIERTPRLIQSRIEARTLPSRYVPCKEVGLPAHAGGRHRRLTRMAKSQHFLVDIHSYPSQYPGIMIVPWQAAKDVKVCRHLQWRLEGDATRT